MTSQRLTWTPAEKAQTGLILIYEAMLQILQGEPQGLSHAHIAREFNIELSYHGGANYASQTLLHQLVYSGEIEKIGEAAQAIYRLSEQAPARLPASTHS